MIRILFVCHGNICRSPMAEFVMKHLVTEEGCRLASSPDEYRADYYVESAATSTEAIGNTIYPPAWRKLKEHGIECYGKTARQMRRDDYGKFDLLIGMDHSNLSSMRRIAGGDPDEKIHLLMEYAGKDREVADPWYTRDFEATWKDVNEGCKALLDKLENKR